MPRTYDDLARGLTDAVRPRLWSGLVIAASLISSVLYAFSGYLLVDVNPGLTELGVDVFLKYLFLVVAVERAAAVFVGMFRNQSKVDWSLRIGRISEVLLQENPPIAVLKQVHARERRLIKRLEDDNVIGKIDDVPESAVKDDYRGFLTSAKHAYEFQRARFDSVSNRYVALVVFVVGIFMAALGLSLFRDLFQQVPAPGPVQAGLLRLTDIFVTGGLLGGGSAGLNAVATKVTGFLNRA